jgi:hypothetical protein
MDFDLAESDKRNGQRWRDEENARLGSFVAVWPGKEQATSDPGVSLGQWNHFPSIPTSGAQEKEPTNPMGN